MSSEHGNDRARFTTTHWSMVLAAQGDSTPTAAEALSQLCERYWYPLYAYLRRTGYRAEEAQDLTQGFFTHIFEKHAIRHADPHRGRFRSFLLTSLKNFIASEWDRTRAQKRGGRVPHISLEWETAEGRYQLEPRDDATPQKVFDRRWALTLLECVLGRLTTEFTSAGKGHQFEHLKVYLTGEEPQRSYAETGATLDMSADAVKVAVHRLRRRFRTHLREEIAQTVASVEEVDDEIRHLWAAVGR